MKNQSSLLGKILLFVGSIALLASCSLFEKTPSESSKNQSKLERSQEPSSSWTYNKSPIPGTKVKKQ